ncbi:pitrilysin family protein [Cyanobium sp. Morenito 9A2]|uniref:M16 family metallopeptidase n=1 Tax=Cyanobium sp. Morenito 9A2 TaxID=2823718 RepID=UPI0020CC1810|nr:pitrilysin family protein [Cyanobium sp. Morenito 9A2]MCP9850517.1 insulinase family protein [Cyanobium sp. Morenito 9A2]
MSPERFAMPGGCPVWVQRRPGPEIVSAKLLIRAGSSGDPVGGRGLTQLLAGVLSRGCGPLNGEALAELVESRGAGLRCEANEDGLLISLKCASADSAALLPLLLTMVQRPWLQPDQVELERHLNLQALQRQREDPFQLAHDQLRFQLYGSGPYGHDPLGVEEDLEQLGPAQLAQRLPDLGREGAVLVICGQPSAPLEPLLEPLETCEPWASFAPPRCDGPGGTPGERLGLVSDDTEQLVLMLGATTVPLGATDALALRLLHCHLGVGMSSRLFVALREQHGLAYDVGVHAPARRGAAPFVFHLSSSAERAAEATTRLLDEWQRLLEVPLASAELALARAKFRGQEALGRQTCSQIADRHALILSHGLDWDYADGALAQSSDLTPADLLGAAQRWLGAPALSLCGPAQALEAAASSWRRHPLSSGPLGVDR